MMTMCNTFVQCDKKRKKEAHVNLKVYYFTEYP